MSESLEDRLRGHAAAFNGLLSLIPSKLYYGNDSANTESTDGPANQKKKKTKAEKKAALKARLDPENESNRTAKDVMEEAGRKKRKLQDLEDSTKAAEESDDDYEKIDGIEPEKPREGLKAVKDRSKKAKTETAVEGEAGKKTEKAPLDPVKEAKRQEKLEAKKQKLEAKKQQKNAAKEETTPATPAKPAAAKTATPKSEAKKTATPKSQKKTAPTSAPEESKSADSSEPSTNDKGTADASNTSSPNDKPRLIKVPEDTEAFRQRFAEKMAALKAARFKADNPDSGKPVRTRQELIEARRTKAIQRKETKKEARQAAKREQDLKREEALASNSPSVMSPRMDLDEVDAVGAAAAAANFSFGRVAFGDGTKMSHDLSYTLSNTGKKGPSDPKTALLKLQNAKKRLAAMTPEKRAEIEEKEAWLTARRRAEGEKIRDDESTLKKAVKRKERIKNKSATEWVKRLDGVAKGKAQRQQKREENLQKRIDGKLEKRLSKAMGKKGGKASSKKKARPGFEGSGFGKKK